MAMFNGYVKLPEGIWFCISFFPTKKYPHRQIHMGMSENGGPK